MSLTLDFRSYRGQWQGYLPDRILEELSSGPMTAAGLALFLRANEGSVNRALYRLRHRGLVASIRRHGDQPNTWKRTA